MVRRQKKRRFVICIVVVVSVRSQKNIARKKSSRFGFLVWRFQPVVHLVGWAGDIFGVMCIIKRHVSSTFGGEDVTIIFVQTSRLIGK